MRRSPRPNDPVFFDPDHKRGPRLRFAAFFFGLIVALWTVAFAVGVMFVDILPATGQFAEIGATTSPRLPAEASLADETCTGEILAPGEMLASGPPLTAAIYLRVWHDHGLPALVNHCGQVNRVIAEWLSINAERQTVDWLSESGADNALRDLRRVSPNVQLGLSALLQMPSVQAAGRNALDDPAARTRIIDALTAKLADGDYSTLCIYPSGYDDAHRAGLVTLLTELDTKLGIVARSCLVAEADSSLWREQSLTNVVDEVILQAFITPTAGSLPMPLAPQDWFVALLADADQAIAPGRLSLALGSMGVLWVEGTADPIPIPFAEALRLASRNHARVTFDPGSLNTQVTYVQGDGRRAEIWLLDAASLHNQLRALVGAKGVKVTLWAAGLEDPGSWALLQSAGNQPVEGDALATLSFPDYVGYQGDGPFLRTAERSQPGHRSFYRDPTTGLITGQIYDVLPRPFTVERYGNLDQKVIALTFDDGPDVEFTTALLDTLLAKRVPATFFVVGSNVIEHPEIVRRMVEEGHEVGSHTFFHPNDADLGPKRVQFELNALQRLLASVTGRSTYLFRMPYGRSEGPLTEAEALPQTLIEAEGYVIAGADAVPRDWEKMTAAEIAGYVVAEITVEHGGQVVVMHDGGGDRENTIAAVPILIDQLRAQGYEFVGLSRFLGLTRDAVMPLAQNRSIFLDGAAFLAISGLESILYWTFWVSIGLGLLRELLVLIFALGRRPHTPDATELALPVTVVVPAFNESLVILDSINAVLASDHPDVTVIVVDDGSTDDTAAVVETAFAGNPRVRLIRQQNGGKWAALNAAYQVIDTEVVVAVDADTLLAPDAIGLLARHFIDPQSGAVAGNVKVGNRGRWLARLQALEYITAQNIDRRAAERIGGMLVIPGCIGAWRAEAVRKVGLYSGDTITEDADLTVSIARAGYRIVFEERAVSTTEVPEAIPPFLKQRLRWTSGMMQMAWKHRRAGRTARGVGLVSIPDLWLTGVLVGLLAPLADLFFLGVVLHAAINLIQGVPVANDNVTAAIIAGWLVLPCLDLVAAFIAFLYERSESKRLLLLLPLQRLVYRPLIYITVYRAVGHALAGRLASWGKLVRHGILGPQIR